MKNPLSFSKFTVSALFLLYALSASSAAFADNSPQEDLHFLENFAVKTYLRGDILQAKKEFERILKIDPANITAKKYLDEMSTQKPLEQNLSPIGVLNRLNDIASDIKGLNEEIISHEKDTKELCLTIRNLISENDSLYVALRKRTRDLAELREQFQGTPYNDQYHTLMKDLPPDRVPQRARQINNVLPDAHILTAPSPAVASREEIDALTQEIAKAEAELKNLRTAPRQDEKKIRELEIALRDKRTLLIEKTATLIENKETLLKFQDQLTTINGSLKDADGRYADALKNIEKIAQEIKTEASLNDAETQKKYRELLNDYAAKIKELDQLKDAIAGRDAAMNQTETTLTDGRKKIDELDSSIKTKNLKIDEYYSLLLKLKAELEKKNIALAEKDTVIAAKDSTIAVKNTAIAAKDSAIAKQDADLKFTDDQLKGVNQKIGSIQGLLKENDRGIADLQVGFSKVKALIHDNTAKPAEVQKPSLPAPVMPAASDGTASLLQKKIDDLSKVVADKNDALSLLRLKIKNIEKELSERESESIRKDDDLLATQEKLATLERKTHGLQSIIDLQKKAEHPAAANETATKPPALVPPASTEVSMLHDILSTKDKTIVELNKKIIAKNVENRELSAMVDACQAKSEEKNALIQEVAALNARLAKAEETNKQIDSSRCAVQNSQLDILEKDTAIKDLQKTLAQKTSALNAADKQVSQLQENLSVIQIKQDAIKNLVDKRDTELAALKNDLASCQEQLIKKAPK